MTFITLPTVLLALLPLITASTVPRDAQEPAAAVAQEQPLITPSPMKWLPTRTYRRRDILSDAASDINSVLGDLGSGIPSYVASGIPNFFQGFPTGGGVQSSLGLSDDQVKALPTQVLNIP